MDVNPKSAWTPLEETNLLDKWEINSLHPWGITTLEELASSLKANPANVGEILKKPQPEMEVLRDRAWAALSAETRLRYEKQPKRRFAYGGLVRKPQ